MSVLTKLSDKAYWSMRKAMVQEVYKSEDHSIACVANKHKVSPSTLWKWCNEDLGPNQRKWLIEKSHAIRGQRMSENKKVQKASSPAAVPVPDPAPMNKPWDKKKARIAAEHAIALPGALKALGISEEVTDVRSVVHATVKPQLDGVPVKVLELIHGHRKQYGATVVINIDEQGKFIKYEVTGDASVQVFTRNK